MLFHIKIACIFLCKKQVQKQVLHLMTSNSIENKIGNGAGRIAKMLEKKATPEQVIDDLYLAAYARLPSAAEREQATRYLQRDPNARRGLEDLAWALLNSREFLFNH